MAVNAIPDGYHGSIPYLTVTDGRAAMAFYSKAFGAEEICAMPMPDGSLAHGEMKIGAARFMLGQANPSCGTKSPKELGAASSGIMIYMANVDAFFERAVAAGATVTRPLQDQFYGDRSGTVTDPDGHQWTFATHVEDVPPDEMQRRMDAMCAEIK